MIVPQLDEIEVGPIDLDPRLVDLVIRQRKQLVALTARHAQDYVRLALTIRKETA